MAAFSGRRTRSGVHLPDAVIEDLLEDGALSDIEGLDELDGEFEPQEFDRLANEVLEPLDVDMDVPPSPIPPPTPPPARGRSSRGRAARGRVPPSPIPPPTPPPARGWSSRSRAARGRSARGNAASGITGRARSVSGVSAQDRSTRGRLAPRTTRDTQRSASTPSTLRGRISASSSINSDQESSRRRLWKQDSFEDKPHQYMPLPTNAVRRPIDYFRDYFDENFIEEVARCTNLYYMRRNGQELKTTGPEITRLFGIHIVMGCIPFPRLPMYWRAETKLELIAGVMARDRFLAIRNALHVVDADTPEEPEKNNPLWKVQPMINKVKNSCNQLERAPGFYSIDEQMIPFTGRFALRQVVKNKPRPVGLKNFVVTTSDGLMLDFDIYRGAKTMFEETTLGLGPSVILHLSKKIPPGSCVFHDRYFTTVALVEEMDRLGLHSTGTIMQNRIPDRATVKFKTDSQMTRGESQQFVRDPVVVVKWKDNKSVLMASNCTGSAETVTVKRWDKGTRSYKDIPAPKVVSNYNTHMGGVDVLDQQMEYYRTFIKTRKWTLKVFIHLIDLALVNSWRLYKNDCIANGLPRRETMALLDFRMDVADTLLNTPVRVRIEVESPPAPRPGKIYRPAIAPSEAKRHDGYDHVPVFDDITAPRTCRMENCSSRSKIRCEKCDAYLCLSRGKDCFKSYHTK